MTEPHIRLRLAGLRSALADPFELSLARCESVAVRGPSGAGKSLFLRMIADLDANQGEVWLDSQPRSRISAPRGGVRWSIVRESRAGGPNRSASISPPSRRRRRGSSPRLKLPVALLADTVARLSTDERRRMALIRALILGPKVLLRDEPTGALDETSTGLVEAALRERLAGGSGLASVAVAYLAAWRLTDDRGRLRLGRLAVWGAPPR